MLYYVDKINGKIAWWIMINISDMKYSITIEDKTSLLHVSEKCIQQKWEEVARKLSL